MFPAKGGRLFGLGAKPAKIGSPSLTAGDATDTFTWTAPNNNGLPITKYGYQTTTDNGSSWSAETETANISAIISTQYSTSSYKIRIRAFNAAGYGEYSDISSGTEVWVSNPATVTQNQTDTSCGTGTCSQSSTISCDCGTQSSTVTRTASRTRSRSKTTNFYSRPGSTPQAVYDTSAFTINDTEWNLGNSGTVGYSAITYTPANFPAHSYGACSGGTKENVTESYGYNEYFSFAGKTFVTEYESSFGGYRAYIAVPAGNFTYPDNYSYDGTVGCGSYIAYHLLYKCSVSQVESVVFVGCGSDYQQT